MDIEAFIAWALDDARDVEERFTTELLIDQGLVTWNTSHKIYEYPTLEENMARDRERSLNPAYDPRLSEEDLRKACEYLARATTWWFHSSRPIRNLAPLRFLANLESISVSKSEITDLSPLTELPRLQKFTIGSLGYDFGNPLCEDFKPLARCLSLRELHLGFNARWPDLTGLDSLPELTHLSLSGNLHALPRGMSFPKVTHGVFHCRPLDARSVADLPQMPACEFLTLSGIERLDGIEKMPRLRNLTLLGPFESFAPLAAMTELTCLTVRPQKQGDPEKLPRDISPLAHLPRLAFFKIGPQFDIFPDMPRDYAPLAEAPALRELIVENCPPVQMEVAAICAGLMPWDDVFLLPEARPLAPLQMVLAPSTKQPRHQEPQPDPGETLIDLGLRECEGRWVSTFTHRIIAERLENSDWGRAEAHALYRTINLTVESFDIVERLPDIVQATREVLARLRPDYLASFGIHLKVKPPVLTPAQQAVEDKFREQQDEEDFEQRQRDQAEYIERLHELELKKQQGLEIDPDDFSPSPYGTPAKTPAGAAPEDDDPEFEIDENDDDDEDGGIAIATDRDPDVDIFSEHDHPLYDNYLCAGTILLDEVWFYSHFAGIAGHLMQRQPDREIPDEKKDEA